MDERDDAGFAPAATPRRFAGHTAGAHPGTPSATPPQPGHSESPPRSPPCFWPPPLTVPAALDDDARVPAAFRCPITYDIMREPAIALSGQTYERSAITRWLTGAHDHFDPITKAPLSLRHLSPNLALRAVIHDWLRERQVDLARWQWRHLRRPVERGGCGAPGAGGPGQRDCCGAAPADFLHACGAGAGCPGVCAAPWARGGGGASVADLDTLVWCLQSMHMRGGAERPGRDGGACMRASSSLTAGHGGEPAWGAGWDSGGPRLPARRRMRRRRAFSADAACTAPPPLQPHACWKLLAPRTTPDQISGGSPRMRAGHSAALVSPAHAGAGPARSCSACAAGALGGCAGTPLQLRGRVPAAGAATADEPPSHPVLSSSTNLLLAQHAPRSSHSPGSCSSAMHGANCALPRFSPCCTRAAGQAMPHAWDACMHDPWLSPGSSPGIADSGAWTYSQDVHAQISALVAGGAWPALDAVSDAPSASVSSEG